MSVQINITTNKERAEIILKRLKQDLPKEAHDGAAKAVYECIREHFRKKQSEPHTWEGTKNFGHSGFWSGESWSVREQTFLQPVSSDTATVVIRSAGLKRKLNPQGPITPKNGKKYLALPATEAAYKFRAMPRDFPGVKFTFTHFPGDPQDHKRPALVNDTGTPIYWLARKTNPKADPTALPSDTTLQTEAIDAIITVIKTLAYNTH